MTNEEAIATIDELHNDVQVWRGKEEAQRRRAKRAEAELADARETAKNQTDFICALSGLLQEHGYA